MASHRYSNWTPRAALVILASLAILSCKKSRETVHPMQESISESVYAYGVIKGRNQYNVYTTVNGRLSEILVPEGSLVRKGQPILRLVNVAPLLNAENAQLAAEYADLTKNADKLKELNVNIDLARNKAINDSLMMIRQQNLWKQSIGSLVEVEQRELAYRNSATALRSAELRYADVKRQLSFADRQSKKNLQISNTVSGDYTVISEIDGRVYTIFKKKGELVTTQSPVAVIGEADAFILELQVDEYDIARIRKGQAIIVRMDSYPGKVFNAAIAHVNPLMNERSKSFTIEAEFTTRPETLYPNLSAEANIILQSKKSALTIPRLYLVNDSTVIGENGEKRHVVIGLKDFNKAEIVSGLTTADKIQRPLP